MASLQRLAFACALALALIGCGFEHGELVEPDAPPADEVTVSFDAQDSAADETSGTVMIPVLLSRAAMETVTVAYTVASGGTATRPDDFALSDGTLTFAPGETEQAISVTIEMDALEETDETIVVELAMPVGATLGAAASHTVTISSDILPRVSFMDAMPSAANEATSPQVELTLTLAPTQDVTVELGVTGTAGAADSGVSDGQVVTFAAGTTSQVVPLGIVQDLLDEDDETIELALQNPSQKLLLAAANTTRMHTIGDDDPLPTVGYAAATSMTNESQAIDVTVQLSAPSGRMVAVAYAASFGTAGAGDAAVTGAPGTLVFMPGQTMKTISIAVTNDTLDEPSETLAVTLASPVNATLGAITANTLTITDDDDPPQAAFAQASASVAETMAAVNMTVQLSSASGFDITVPFTVAGTSSANNPEDYTLASAAALVIPAGMTSASVVVNVKPDTFDEANETVVVDLGTPTNATLGAVTRETLTITDDDAGPTVAFTSMGASTNEGNSNITLTVELSDISGQDVTVPYAIGASTATSPADYTISPASPIVIPAGSTSTTISIAVKEDTVDESDETVVVTLGNPTNATLATPSTYTLTIRDDDQEPDVSWNPMEMDTSEAEGTHPGNQTRPVTFTMVLSAASAFTVTVPILYTGTAASGSDYSGPASVTFAPGTTSANVVLDIVRDAVNEPGAAETIIMTLDVTNVTNATAKAPLTRTYSIADDD